jgi:hypothetical protein
VAVLFVPDLGGWGRALKEAPTLYAASAPVPVVLRARELAASVALIKCLISHV